MVPLRACWLSAAVLALLNSVNAQIKPLNITQEDYLSIPATCLTVLTQNVNCAPVLLHARGFGGGLSQFYTDKSLTDLCTSACTSSLTTWHRRVVGACANVRVPSSIGKLTLVAQWAQEFLETYQTTCLGDGSGKLCNSVLREAFGINPTNQEVTVTGNPSAICNTCFLSMLSTQLRMPLAATDTRLLDMYKTATSRCSTTGWTIPPTPVSTQWDSSVSIGPGPEPTCSGRSVPVSGQSCQQISMTNRVSTNHLLEANGLGGGCYGFPTSGNLCIPSNAVCTPYTVRQTDTCGAIARANDISPVQLMSWNLQLGVDCSGLASAVGFVICVSQPGGNWVNPDPPPPTTTRSLENLPSLGGMSEIAALPTPSRAGWDDTLEVAPFADGSRHDCTLYAQAPILTDWQTDTYSSTCAAVAAAYNVAVSDLVAWNPSLAGDCTLREDRQYCVQIHDDQARDVSDYCAEFALAQPGWDCSKYVAAHGLEMSQFLAWNPAVGTSCADFQTGVSYCIDVWKYRQGGIVSTCNKFVVANNTRWVDNPCRIIEDKFGVGHQRFVAWNPAVRTNCTGLYVNYEYCISIPGYRPTFSTTAAPRQT